MTQNKKVKDAARRYAAEHGVGYTEALRIVMAEHKTLDNGEIQTTGDYPDEFLKRLNQ